MRLKISMEVLRVIDGAEVARNKAYLAVQLAVFRRGIGTLRVDDLLKANGDVTTNCATDIAERIDRSFNGLLVIISFVFGHANAHHLHADVPVEVSHASPVLVLSAGGFRRGREWVSWERAESIIEDHQAKWQ
jgi:hypothetical protein